MLMGLVTNGGVWLGMLLRECFKESSAFTDTSQLWSHLFYYAEYATVRMEFDPTFSSHESLDSKTNQHEIKHIDKTLGSLVFCKVERFV